MILTKNNFNPTLVYSQSYGTASNGKVVGNVVMITKGKLESKTLKYLLAEHKEGLDYLAQRHTSGKLSFIVDVNPDLLVD